MAIIIAIYNCMLCYRQANFSCYKISLIIAAVHLEKVSCFVYKTGKGRYAKPPIEFYKKHMLEDFAESPEETYRTLSHTGIPEGQSYLFHKKLCKIYDLICPMVACRSEQAFVSEYAYAIDYVLKYGESLEKPIMDGIFPTNYSEFNYGKGIAAEIEEVYQLYAFK